MVIPKWRYPNDDKHSSIIRNLAALSIGHWFRLFQTLYFICHWLYRAAGHVTAQCLVVFKNGSISGATNRNTNGITKSYKKSHTNKANELIARYLIDRLPQNSRSIKTWIYEFQLELDWRARVHPIPVLRSDSHSCDEHSMMNTLWIDFLWLLYRILGGLIKLVRHRLDEIAEGRPVCN